jgi:prefoldin subunit 5
LIQDIKNEIEEFQQQSNMLEKKVATLKQYEEYLEQVMKTNSGSNDT